MEEQTNTTQSPPTIKNTKRFYAGLAVVIFAILVVVVFRVTSSNNKSHSKAAPVAVVHITKTGFVPATLSVKQGTRVVWDNADSDLHQVASNPYPKDTGLPGLKSEILNNAQTYTFVANTTGSFGYHDQINPTINGTLVVKK